MHKKLLAMGVLTMGLATMGLLSACQDPIAAKQMEAPQSQVTMEDDYLKETLLVYTPVVERAGAGQLKVTMKVYNRTGDPVNIDYKYYFTDANHTPIDDGPVTGWLKVPGGVPPHETAYFTFESLSAAPMDFHVALRRGR